MNPKRTDVVSASEIASWAWCPESWRLEAVGEAPENLTEITRGRTFHARTAALEVSSGRAMRLAGWFLILALVLGLVGAVLWSVVAGAGR